MERSKEGGMEIGILGGGGEREEENSGKGREGKEGGREGRREVGEQERKDGRW